MFPRDGSIRAVMFDAVGTLIRPTPGMAAAYLAAARRFDAAGSLDEREVERRFRAAFARQETLDRAANWATDEHRERRRWRDIVAEVFGDVSRETELFDALWRHFAEPRHWQLIDAAREQLAAAQAAGAIVGIASNFDARLHAIVAANTDLNIIARDHVFISSEIGWRKPSAEFFQAIERRLGLASEQILLIGDDVDNDALAARTAGWRAVLIGEGRAGE